MELSGSEDAEAVAKAATARRSTPEAEAFMDNFLKKKRDWRNG
jgi:hypothetical protein